MNLDLPIEGDWHGWIETAESYFDQGEEARMWRCLLRWAAQMDYLSC